MIRVAIRVELDPAARAFEVSFEDEGHLPEHVLDAAYEAVRAGIGVYAQLVGAPPPARPDPEVEVVEVAHAASGYSANGDRPGVRP